MLAPITNVKLRLCLHYKHPTSVKTAAHKILLWWLQLHQQSRCIDKSETSSTKEATVLTSKLCWFSFAPLRLLRSILLLAAIFTAHIVLLLVFLRVKSCISKKPHRIQNVEFFLFCFVCPKEKQVIIWLWEWRSEQYNAMGVIRIPRKIERGGGGAKPREIKSLTYLLIWNVLPSVVSDKSYHRSKCYNKLPSSPSPTCQFSY